MENKQIFLVFSTFVDYEYQVPLLKKWIDSKKKNNRELNSFGYSVFQINKPSFTVVALLVKDTLRLKKRKNYIRAT